MSARPIVAVDPRDPAFFQDPYRYYAQWHRDHSRFYWKAYERWCFSGFNDVSQLLRDKRFGRSFDAAAAAPACPVARAHLASFDALEEHSLLNLEPPRHTALRQLVNRAFVSSKVERLRGDIEALAHQLLDALADEAECDLLTAYLMPLPATVIARLLGVPDEHVPQLLSWSHAMVKVYTLTQSHEDEVQANVAAEQFQALLLDIVAHKRRYPTDDLLSHLVTVELSGAKLTDAEIVSSAVLLLNAGHEATVHQSGNAIKTVLQLGLDAAALFSTPKRSAATVEEALRFDAPLHVFMRYALQDVDLGEGVVIAAGEEIALLLAAANRDPTRFSRANEFLAERDDGAHVSFGAGIHFCLGAPLAKLEMQTSLAVFFQRFPRASLAEGARYADSFHFHGLEKLRLKLH